MIRFSSHRFKGIRASRILLGLTAGLLFGFRIPAFVFALDQSFDHSAWDQFLKEYVHEDGRLDYQAAKEHPELLDRYLRQLASIDGFDLRDHWPREERLALWLNAYHAGLVRIVLDHYPVKSIQDIPGVWDSDRIGVAGRFYSLNDIRSRHLIGYFRDEKIHAALACGAVSCPRLRQEAYVGPRVEGQLHLATREFVNDPARNRILSGQKKIELSRIFKWYGGDFQLDFGRIENDRGLSPSEYAVLSFVAHYLEDSEKIRHLEEGDYKLRYLPFDWALNDGARNNPLADAHLGGAPKGN